MPSAVSDTSSTRARRRPTNRLTRAVGTSTVLTALLATVTLLFANGARAAQAPVDLGTADSFAVLAGSTVTNSGPSVISGDVGVSPGSAVIGFAPPGIVTNGAIHQADAVAETAQTDLTTAYNAAAGRAATMTFSPELGGLTLKSGVYSGGELAVTGTLTLDAEGDPNAVFIFQAASTLVTASNSTVNLTNGAQACNAFWQVGSSATFGTGSIMVGNILALTSITANTGAAFHGRLLARNGAVTLDSNTVTKASCLTGPATTPSPSGVPGPTVPGLTVPGSGTTVPGSGTTVAAGGGTGTGSGTTVPAGGGTGTGSTVPGSGTTVPGGGTGTGSVTTVPGGGTGTGSGTTAPGSGSTVPGSGTAVPSATTVPASTLLPAVPSVTSAPATTVAAHATVTTRLGSTTGTVAEATTTTSAGLTTATTTRAAISQTSLAFTGSNAVGLAGAALALIAVGLAVTYGAMRRQQ